MSAPFPHALPRARKEWTVVQRIVLVGCLLCGLALGAQAQEGQAVGVMVFVEQGQVTSLDVSFPAVTTMGDIQDDLKALAQWTGWDIVGQPAEATASSVSVHAQVNGGAVASILTDAVWPVIGALARYRRLGIVVMGAPVATARLTIENEFARLEQSGGQGVQSYQAFVKSLAFRSLDELRHPALPARAPRPRGGSLALAWALAVVAAIASGVAVYMVVNRRRP
jgi:hypothetical protein